MTTPSTAASPPDTPDREPGHQVDSPPVEATADTDEDLATKRDAANRYADAVVAALAELNAAARSQQEQEAGEAPATTRRTAA